LPYIFVFVRMCVHVYAFVCLSACLSCGCLHLSHWVSRYLCVCVSLSSVCFCSCVCLCLPICVPGYVFCVCLCVYE
jgi:hypothetical protein